jgi:hypothetical protein
MGSSEKDGAAQTRSTGVTRFLARKSVVYTIIGAWVALLVVQPWCPPEFVKACSGWSYLLWFLLTTVTFWRPERGSKPLRITFRPSWPAPYAKPLFIAFFISLYIHFGLLFFFGGVTIV